MDRCRNAENGHCLGFGRYPATVAPEPFSEDRVEVSPKGEIDMSNYVMWISLFAATMSLGICFCVATIMMQPKSDRS
jgi:hypothetical protein